MDDESAHYGSIDVELFRRKILEKAGFNRKQTHSPIPKSPWHSSLSSGLFHLPFGSLPVTMFPRVERIWGRLMPIFCLYFYLCICGPWKLHAVNVEVPVVVLIFIAYDGDMSHMAVCVMAIVSLLFKLIHRINCFFSRPINADEEHL